MRAWKQWLNRVPGGTRICIAADATKTGASAARLENVRKASTVGEYRALAKDHKVPWFADLAYELWSGKAKLGRGIVAPPGRLTRAANGHTATSAPASTGPAGTSPGRSKARLHAWSKRRRRGRA